LEEDVIPSAVLKMGREYFPGIVDSAGATVITELQGALQLCGLKRTETPFGISFAAERATGLMEVPVILTDTPAILPCGIEALSGLTESANVFAYAGKYVQKKASVATERYFCMQLFLVY